MVDVREGGPVRQAEQGAARARALRDDCLTFFPPAIAYALPMLDGIAKRWLTRSQSPYIGEIERIARTLGFSGVWFLNGSYQWGCTTLAREENGTPWLVRALDWPFPGLGRHVEIARKRGAAGEYHSLSWPGYVGELTASAPGRFAASINQAPLWRRMRQPWLRPVDIMANAVGTWKIRFIPPDQLLRQVFETCADFDAARAMLERTPVARPVIYTLVGVKPGERCVIERTEQGFTTRCTATAAANDWLEQRDSWEARIGGDMLLTCRTEEAADNSRCRREALEGFDGSIEREPFGWLREPVQNRYTRLAVEFCPARGILRAMGLDQASDGGPAQPVTQMRELRASALAA